MQELINEAKDMLLTEEQLLQEFSLNLKDLAHKAGDWIKGKFGRGIQPWGMYSFQYEHYQNDPEPLCIMFGMDETYNRWFGINLHYMHPGVRAHIAESIKKVDEENLHEVTGMFSELGFSLRSYKTGAISSVKRITTRDFVLHKVTSGDSLY